MDPHLVPLQGSALGNVGFWILTAALGGILTTLAWLVRRHFLYAVPTFQRVFGYDRDPTNLGLADETMCRLDELDEDIISTNDAINTLRENQQAILENQKAIADQLGADVPDPTVKQPSIDPDEVRRHIARRQRRYTFKGDPTRPEVRERYSHGEEPEDTEATRRAGLRMGDVPESEETGSPGAVSRDRVD